MITDFCSVTCPACCESFAVPAPSPDELPAEVDYDCEVCCHPMRIRFHLVSGDEPEGVDVDAEAIGLGDL